MGTEKDFFCIDPYSRRAVANYPFVVSRIEALFTQRANLANAAKVKAPAASLAGAVPFISHCSLSGSNLWLLKFQE